MTHCVMLLALLLAQGVPNQVISPVGRPTTSAINIQADPAHPLPVSATVNVAGAADLAGNTATFNANNICTSVITAGEQSVGFHLSAGTLDATLTPYITNQTAAINCATAGTCTVAAFSSGAIIVTNPNGVKDVGVNVVGGARQVQVCTTTFASGSAAGVVTATYLQAASAGGGGGGGVVTQGTSPWVVSAASLPLPTGASTSSLQTTGNTSLSSIDSKIVLPGALDASGGVKTHEVGTAAVSAASLPLPTGASTESTLALIKAKTDNLDVALSTRTKPADTQNVTGPVTDAQLRASAVPTTDAHTTAAAPLASRLTDGAAFYDATKTGQLPAALDASGGVKTHEVGTAAISAASLPLPTGASTDRTTAAAPFSVRISDGAAFIDPRSIRALTVADIVTVAQGAAGASAWLVTGAGGTFPVTGTFFQATQPVSLAAAVDVSDRAARLLGITYGSQGQQIKQTATNFNLQAELAVGGTLIDPRSIRALTSGDTVTAVQPTGTNFHMVCDSGCGGAATFADLAAFVAGTTPVNVMAGEFNDTPLADVASGNAAAARITKQRAMHVNLRDSAGNEVTSLGSSGQITDGAGSTNKATVLPGYQSADATDSALVVKLSPDSKINLVNIGTKSYNVLNAPTIRVMTVDPSGRPATVLGANRAALGNENAQVVAVSPIPSPICPGNAALSQTASTTVIAGKPGQVTYICKVFVVSTTAQSISLIEGTGTACGTLGTALAGSITVANGMGVAANAGWVEGNGAGIVYTAAKVGDDICVLQSGAGNLAGSISYVQRSIP